MATSGFSKETDRGAAGAEPAGGDGALAETGREDGEQHVVLLIIGRLAVERRPPWMASEATGGKKNVCAVDDCCHPSLLHYSLALVSCHMLVL